LIFITFIFTASTAVFDACVKGYVNTLGMAKNSVVEFLKGYNSWSRGAEKIANTPPPTATAAAATQQASEAQQATPSVGLKVKPPNRNDPSSLMADDSNRELGLIGLGLRTYLIKTKNNGKNNLRRSAVGFMMRSMRL
jgi:hypothetical protein